MREQYESRPNWRTDGEPLAEVPGLFRGDLLAVDWDDDVPPAVQTYLVRPTGKILTVVTTCRPPRSAFVTDADRVIIVAHRAGFGPADGYGPRFQEIIASAEISSAIVNCSRGHVWSWVKAINPRPPRQLWVASASQLFRVSRESWEVLA